MRFQAASRPECGFTLVEVLLSVSITTIAFVGIFSTYITSLAVQEAVDDRAKVLFLVQKTVEEAIAVDYDDLDIGTTVEVIRDELDGYLFVTSTVVGIQDPTIGGLWTRFSDPDPLHHYKQLNVKAQWGPLGSPSMEDWESVEISAIRVERENTVDFSERASSQLPWL